MSETLRKKLDSIVHAVDHLGWSVVDTTPVVLAWKNGDLIPRDEHTDALSWCQRLCNHMPVAAFEAIRSDVDACERGEISVEVLFDKLVVAALSRARAEERERAARIADASAVEWQEVTELQSGYSSRQVCSARARTAQAIAAAIRAAETAVRDTTPPHRRSPLEHERDAGEDG